MKTKRIIILLAIAITLLGCNSGEIPSVEESKFDKYFANNDNFPLVSGKIINLSEEELKNTELRYSLVTPFEQNQFQIKKFGKINPDGSFTLELDYAFPYQQIWLSVGDYFYAGIYANTDLLIELNADSLRHNRAFMYGPGVNYLGTDGQLNTILNKHFLFNREEQIDIDKALSNIRHDRKLEYEVFERMYDSLYTILHKIDNEFIENNPSPYSWIIKNERLSDYYGDLCVKHWDPKGHKMSTELFEKIKNHKAYLISNSSSTFYNYLVSLLMTQAGKYDKIDFADFGSYSKLTEIQKNEINEISQIQNIMEAGASYDTIRLKQLSKSAYQYLNDTLLVYRTLKHVNYIDSIFNERKADFLKIKISSREPKEKKIILEILLENINTQWCRTILQTHYDESIKKLNLIEGILKNGEVFQTTKNIGKPILELPFGAKLYQVDELEAEELLTNIKTAFKGKALVLDFWATWCAPCLVDLPYSKKLHDEMKDKPIEFVYLCTSSGSDLEKWKSKISELKIGGTHIFVKANIESKLMNLFSFNGFPSYAFINADGDYKAGAISRMGNLKMDDLTTLMENE